MQVSHDVTTTTTKLVVNSNKISASINAVFSLKI